MVATTIVKTTRSLGTRSNKNAWKTQPPSNKTKLDKYVEQIPVYKKKVNRKVFQWCQRCGDSREWVLSHDTATHQDDFKHKKHRNHHKHSVQVNIREELVPDAILWLAKFHHPKPRSHGISCIKRSTKLFGRSLKRKTMINNNKIKVNKWYPVDCSVPPADPGPISPPLTPKWYPNKDPLLRSMRCSFYKHVVMDMLILMVMCLLTN